MNSKRGIYLGGAMLVALALTGQSCWTQGGVSGNNEAMMEDKNDTMMRGDVNVDGDVMMDGEVKVDGDVMMKQDGDTMMEGEGGVTGDVMMDDGN